MDTSEAGVPETMMQKLSQKEEEAVIQRRSWAQETELHQEQTHKSECERNFLFKHHWWGSVYLLPANLFNRFCPVDFFFNCSMLISDEIIISLWIPGVIRRALFPSLVKSLFLFLPREYEALAHVTEPAPSNADHASDPQLWLSFSRSVMSDSLQPQDCSLPGSSVLHCLPEFAQN